MFYFYTFLYSLKSCFKPEFPSSAKHKSNFEEGSKPNNYWSTVFPTVKVNVEQLFGYPHSSKYLLTDVNVCRVVQYIDMAGVTRTAADRMCAVARYNDISSKADSGDIYHPLYHSYRTDRTATVLQRRTSKGKELEPPLHATVYGCRIK